MSKQHSRNNDKATKSYIHNQYFVLHETLGVNLFLHKQPCGWLILENFRNLDNARTSDGLNFADMLTH